ncbi:hypothetical protein MPPM_2571 [Methylorubrum populi]|uniref:Uncharacterized protein n=1 Tax=Methylorubrum populi TaxID=223967 RepID=A0A160PF01_9HYPH|nr:hypothetical protein MPPM_2571 [Methylorubrum populi]
MILPSAQNGRALPEVRLVSVAASSISISATKKSRRTASSRRPMPRLASDREIVVGRANVPDPFEPGSYREVAINRRVDVLAQELAAKRIERAEFEVGRMVQAVFERGSGARLGSGGWNAGGSRDQTIAHELAIIYAIDDAERVRKFTARLEQAIGGVGVRFLRAILAEGQTFAAYAARTGRGSGDRAATDVAKRFRWLLESLTEEQHTATGAEGQHIRATREAN